jgi:hypothetical protein
MTTDEKLDSLMEHAAASRAWQVSVNEKLEAIPALSARVGSLERSRSYALGAAKVVGVVAGGALAVFGLVAKFLGFEGR